MRQEGEMGIIYFRTVLYLLTSGFVLAFLVMFLPKRHSPWKTCMYVLPILGAMILTDVFRFNRQYIYSQNTQMVATIIEMFLVILAALAISKYRDFRAIFIGLTGLSFGVVGKIIGSTFFIYNDRPVIGLLGAIITEIAMFYLIKNKVKNAHIKLMEDWSKGWGRLCIVPLMFYLTINIIGYLPYSVYERPDQLLPMTALILTLAGTYAMFFGFMRSRTEAIEGEKRNAIMAAYTHGLEAQFREIESTRCQVRILRHDMRHYANLIGGFLDQENYEGIREVLSDFAVRTEEGSLETYCNNKFINGILCGSLAEAREKNIEIKTMMDLPSELSINEIEFAAAVANLLENAIRATNKVKNAPRVIEATSKRVGEKILLEIVNPYEEELVIDEESGLPLSKGGGLHGNGLASVVRYAEKNQGIFDFTYKDKTFIVRLLI